MDDYGETYQPGMMGHNQPPEPWEDESLEEDEDDRGPDAMSEEELAGLLHTRLSTSTNRDDDEVSAERQEALNYYLGREYGDEEEGYSSVVTRDVFELVEWFLASMVRIFLSAPRIVEFKPNGAEDIQQAEQETEVVHQHMNKAFIQLMSWVRDAALYPNAYLKVWHDEEPKTRETDYQGLTMAQVGMLNSDPDIEIVWYEEVQGAMMPLYNVGIRHTTYSGKLRLEAVPPEEILVDPNESQLSLDECRFFAHHRQIYRSELVAMGYDRAWVEELPSSADLDHGDERTNRRYTTDETVFNDDELTDTVDYYECYMLVDWDNDGIEERRKICAVGTSGTVEIVENEVDEYQPICTLSVVPQPHRHIGVSLAHSGKWVQRVSSVLTRQMLDNLYRTNRPRQFAGPGVNLEQLESYVPHGIVEVSNVDSVRPEVIQTVVDKVLPVLQHFDQEKEAGSGVSRHTMGLDAEKLQDTTMGAYVNALGQASQRLELIARTFAETGFAELANKLHYLIRTNQDVAGTHRIHGTWVEVNPESWADERDTEPCVGLGYGTHQERVASGMAILDLQREAIQHGLSDQKRIYNNLQDVLRAMGRRDASTYFVDPESEEGQQLRQQQQEMQQAQEQKMEQMLDAQMAEASKENTIKLAELRAEIQGAGVEAGKVTPMRVGNA